MVEGHQRKGRIVPWFKCSHCRIRRSGLDVAISATQDRCPLCGRTLDPERDLAALMGFSFLAGDQPATAAETSQLPAGEGRTSDADTDAFGDALAAERWLDEGGSSGPGR
jgi:hypothetical protein